MIFAVNLNRISRNGRVAVIKNMYKEVIMKAHRFFAWAAVVCFAAAMITGYKRV